MPQIRRQEDRREETVNLQADLPDQQHGPASRARVDDPESRETSTRERTTHQRDVLHGPTGYTTVEPVLGSEGPPSQQEIDERDAEQQ